MKRGSGNRGSRKSLQRRASSRTPKPTMLIVCEGSKTEWFYFEGFRKAKRLNTIRIRVIGGDEAGTHPKSIVKYAKETQSKAKKDGIPFDSVWCVFDRDEHQNIGEAFVQARDNEFGIAFSNPSFELWYVLHFQTQGASIKRDDIVDVLKKHIPRYRKAADVYDQLAPYQSDACECARQLRRQHKIDDERCTSESPNPSTWVDKLVEALDELS